MRTTQQLSVTVTLDQAEYITDKVAAGTYASESEVIRDGLRALAERDRAIEKWLQKTVAATYDRVQAGGGKFHTIEEARAKLSAAN